VSATTGWPPTVLDELTATQLLRYAIACLEHEAHRLLRKTQLFLLPLESYAGGCEIRNHLHATVRRMLGLPDEAKRIDRLTDEERGNIEEGIAEVERELAAQHSWYADDLKRSQTRAAHSRRKVRQHWLGDKRLLGDVRRFLRGR
jgi:(p)ppGpp synthase/HD superfamily hydrolase